MGYDSVPTILTPADASHVHLTRTQRHTHCLLCGHRPSELIPSQGSPSAGHQGAPCPHWARRGLTTEGQSLWGTVEVPPGTNLPLPDTLPGICSPLRTPQVPPMPAFHPTASRLEGRRSLLNPTDGRRPEVSVTDSTDHAFAEVGVFLQRSCLSEKLRPLEILELLLETGVTILLMLQRRNLCGQ